MSAPPPSGSRWIHAFDETPTTEDAAALLGGKGASLGAMSRAGMHVPPGFTITTEACRSWTDHNGSWPEDLAVELDANLQRLEQQTGRQFGRGQNPLFVSVRSGAAASMPGMMDTILNCGIAPALADELGDTPHFWAVCVQFIETFAKIIGGLAINSSSQAIPSRRKAQELMDAFAAAMLRPFPVEPRAQLAEAIDAVFRSWSSERAIAYRKRHDIRELAGTAVNVQAMFPSRVSGVVFTQDPNNLRAERLVIESAFGLGEAVVSGNVSPDRFLVKRADLAAIEIFPGKKTSAISALGDDSAHDPHALTLSAAQVAELCTLSLAVERHFGKAMDIEWGYAERQFALLQARPIRGLDVAEEAEVARAETVLRLRALAAKKRRVWVTHNLRETLRAPTPLTWDVVRDFMSGAGGFGLMYQDFGHRPSAEVCEHGFLELICGRIYADPDRLAELVSHGLPMRYDLAAVVRDKSVLEAAPTKFEADQADEALLFKLPRAVWAMLRSSRALKRLRGSARARFEQEVLPPYLEYVSRTRSQDLAKLTTNEVINELHQRRVRVLNEFGKESLKPGFFGGGALAELKRVLVQLMGESEGASLTATLTTALENDSTYEQDALLYQVAAGETTLEEFLDRYGHRTTGEMELSEARWREDPSYLQKVVAQIQRASARSMPDLHAENLRKFHEMQAALPEMLASCGGSSFAEDIEQQLATARALLPYRETGKHYLMMGYELIRLALLELARRWELGNDLFFLHLAELEHFETRRAELLLQIARRKTRWKAEQRFELADVIDSEHLTEFGTPIVYENATEWQGEAVSGGVANGTARIVLDPRDVPELGFDYILVCPSTDPGWTPLFINARGLIVERGGVLSHGAIVARDFGIPAIVCPGATAFLRAGERIRVDGHSGKIARLEDAGS